MAQNALVSALAQCRKLAQLQKIVLIDYFESIGPLERKSHAKYKVRFQLRKLCLRNTSMWRMRLTEEFCGNVFHKNKRMFRDFRHLVALQKIPKVFLFQGNGFCSLQCRHTKLLKCRKTWNACKNNQVGLSIIHSARLAQSVERWTLNPTVVGSSPTLGER